MIRELTLYVLGVSSLLLKCKNCVCKAGVMTDELKCHDHLIFRKIPIIINKMNGLFLALWRWCQGDRRACH